MPTPASDERWLPVVGWEGLYEVSDRGRVRYRTGRLKSTKPDRRGYVKITLHDRSRKSTVDVHRLVLRAFVGPPPEGTETRHLDGVHHNNALTNLIYGTHSENLQDKVRHGTHHEASKTYCPQGHEYTEKNTYLNNGKRACRACRRERNKQARRRRRSKA